jgi:hypothetical protein
MAYPESFADSRRSCGSPSPAWWIRSGKLIVTPFVDNRAKEISLRLGVEICTDITALS